MSNDGGEWYAIENDFWCPCQDKLLTFGSRDEHLPDCAELKHKILFKVSENIDFSPEVISEPTRGVGKGRNSVVEEFLANLETLNTSRRRSSSKLLQGFVVDEDMTPSVATRSPGLEVYFPACFSPSNLEKLVGSLDQDEFQLNINQNTTIDDSNAFGGCFATSPEENNGKSKQLNVSVVNSTELDDVMQEQKEMLDSKVSGIHEATEKLYNFSLHGSEDKIARKDVAMKNLTRERLRRSTMNESFAKLREVIPDIDSREKISKVGILRKAVKCIKQLEHEETIYYRLKTEEKIRNKELLHKLVELNEKPQ